MAKKVRADELIVFQGLVESRTKSQACILAGQVWNDSERIKKPSQLLSPDTKLRIEHPLRYVGRGGLKMENFLTQSKLCVEGSHFLDLGASTGGFTDCLLQHGATSATCVDVGRGQLHYKLRTDSRVTNFEQTNIRSLKHDQLPWELYPLIVMDLSFISLCKVLKDAWKFLQHKGILIALAKPQFECTKAEADRGRGVIKSSLIHERVILKIEQFAKESLEGATKIYQFEASPKGNDGNTEFFLGWTKED